MAGPCFSRLQIAAFLPAHGNYLFSKGCRLFQRTLHPYCTHTTRYEPDKETHQKRSASTLLEDPGHFFIKPNVQDILKRLTGLNLEKVYRVKPGLKRTPPRYEFMTEKQLQKAIEDAKRRAETKLQMPPVLKAREPITEVITTTPELIGYDSSKILFVDISHGYTERTRTIVSREFTDGTLRRASWEDRDRMNNMFYPVTKRKFGLPRMFQDEYFPKILDAEEYEFILDRACLQFEPDDPLYIKACHLTYDHIDKRQKYDILHSTRHFGPMVFYLAFYGVIDNLVIHLMQKNRLDEAADLVKLFCLVKPDSKTSKSDLDSTPLSLIKTYTRSDSPRPSQLELMIQTVEELLHRQQELLRDIKEAHGQT